jgi:hypothetical protein
LYLLSLGDSIRSDVNGGVDMPRKIRKDIKVENLVDKYGIPQPRAKSGRKIRKDAKLDTVKKKLSHK